MQIPQKARLKIDKIKKLIKQLPVVLAEKAFWSFLALLLFNLGLGVFIFYRYDFSVQRKQIEISEKPQVFRQDLYQKILNAQAERKARLIETDSKIYPDLFRPQ